MADLVGTSGTPPTGSELVPAQTGPRFWVQVATIKQPYGPLSEEQLKQWIREKRVQGSDLICRERGTAWVRLTESDMRGFLLQTIHDERLLASTCPRCGAEMIAMARNRTAWLIVFWLGLFSSVACVGIPLVIIGWSMAYGKKAKAYLTCPRCKYVQG